MKKMMAAAVSFFALPVMAGVSYDCTGSSVIQHRETGERISFTEAEYMYYFAPWKDDELVVQNGDTEVRLRCEPADPSGRYFREIHYCGPVVVEFFENDRCEFR